MINRTAGPGVILNRITEFDLLKMGIEFITDSMPSYHKMHSECVELRIPEIWEDIQQTFRCATDSRQIETIVPAYELDEAQTKVARFALLTTANLAEDRLDKLFAREIAEEITRILETEQTASELPIADDA
jgi:hypothetical protein